MTHLEIELKQIKEAILDMMVLAKSQLEKSKIAFLNFDSELAEEIVHNEKRLNAMELSIDRDCENILALFQPVATDLRLVIAVLKINADLERIGDYADGIADYVLDIRKPISPKAIETSKVREMFEIAITMMNDLYTSYNESDVKLARKIYKKDSKLNKINKKASSVITNHINEDSSNIPNLLYLFSTIRKLERVGDRIKNITEDIVFYLEAEVAKHRKKKMLGGGD